jgi:hypothetical protein
LVEIFIPSLPSIVTTSSLGGEEGIKLISPMLVETVSPQPGTSAGIPEIHLQREGKYGRRKKRG